jgi:non-specific serine/threonine protein kinase/serine/threonine-protein kinase
LIAAVLPGEDLTRHPHTDPADDDALDLPRVGPYRLVRELGRGGMGTVYLAVRSDDEFQKRVAVKVLRRGMDTDAIVRRFRHERQILASLQHPYIATLLDGGTTDAGLPYFAMEYVEGQVISSYCDARHLPVAARLELFRKVCSAVQYAHQNLVIHRDIKPANVLVTSDGTPKLLDFGIAKLLNPEIAGQTIAPTAAGLHLMTPEYASPEQVRGEPVSTASDIYSLGVLLYELLTGRRPYRLTSRAPAELVQVICHATPVRPSTAVATTIDRAGEATTGPDGDTPTVHLTPLPINPTPARAERLRRRLAGDLDNIVLKALSKEPDRRYASVDQFSEDIRRHLVGLPVIARKDTVRYRTAKFVQRNRVAVAAAVITFTALVAAVAITTWQARVASTERQRAEQRFEDVRALANTFLFELHDAIRDLPGSTPARQILVTRGLEYLDKLARELPAPVDHTLTRDIANGYVRLGDVQGRPFNPNLGDTSGAMASYRKAIALLEPAQAAAPSDTQLRRDLATAYLRVSALDSAMGNTREALELAQKSLALIEPLDAAAATPPDIRRELVAAETAVGDLLSSTGNTQAALEHRRRVVGTMEALLNLEPADSGNLRQMAIAYQKLANTLGNPNYPNVGDYAGALENLTRSGDVLRKAVTLYPTSSMFKRNLAVADSNTSDVLTALKRPEEALARQRRALSVFTELSNADPANVAALNDVAISTYKVAQMLESSGQLDAAAEEYRQSLAIHERLSAQDPSNAAFREQVMSGSSGLATAEGKRGNRAAALEYHQRAVAISRELSAANPGNVELRVSTALALIERARTLTLFKETAPAIADYRQAIETLEALQKQGAIEGTDVETLDTARSELQALTGS